MKIFVFLLCVLCLIYLTESINIQCSFSETSNYLGRSHYYCSPKSSLNIISYDIIIESINGSHTGGKNNDDVEGFYSQDGSQNTQYFPKNLEKIFKNLKVIVINGGRIKEVHQSDLKPIPLLEVIHLFENDIQVIEAGLFDFNPNLKLIYLHYCKVVHIDSKVFDHLTKATYLYLSSNPCINKDISSGRAAVQTLAQEAYSKCRDRNYITINAKLRSLESESIFLTPENYVKFYDKLTDVEIEVKTSNNFFYYPPFLKKIENLRNLKVHSLMSQSETCLPENVGLYKKIDDLEESLKSLNSELNIKLQGQLSNVEDSQIDIVKKLNKLDADFKSTQFVKLVLPN